MTVAISSPATSLLPCRTRQDFCESKIRRYMNMVASQVRRRIVVPFGGLLVLLASSTTTTMTTTLAYGSFAFGFSLPLPSPSSRRRSVTADTTGRKPWKAESSSSILLEGAATASPGAPRLHGRPSSTATATQLQCICIHCKYVTDCSAYHFVEAKHDQPHITSNPTFTPRDGSPTIHANVRTVTRSFGGGGGGGSVFDVMRAEHEEQTAEATSTSFSGEDEQQRRLVGSKVYDVSPSVTVEYDVVACQDFVLEQDCWVRNMPEEIRRANPHFVPT